MDMQYLSSPPPSFNTASPYPQLKKRALPDQPPVVFNRTTAPKLPPISNTDLVLQIFTHSSLRTRLTCSSLDQYDNERLSWLGKHVLDSVVTELLFDTRPMLRAGEIVERKEELLCDDLFEEWVTHYGLLRKLRYDPVLRESSGITKPQETRDIFYAYTAGVYLDSGAPVVREWIQTLLGQNLNIPNRDKLGQSSSPMHVEEGPMSPPRQALTPPPTKKVKAETMSPGPETIFFGSQPGPPAPAFKPPPPPPVSSPPAMQQVSRASMSSHGTRPNPLAPARPNLPFLPLFNQTAAQRRVSVEYDAQFSGPSHAGTWLVRCIVNGIPKGEGTGSSKQNAKEEAARQAYYAMGWT
ncbi:hypothetical protein CC1G_01759 [Coprinopsis cinerea okayama7|uniref:RNase III domain-containing protein n=1 Tax=Coprinopsis cinerea (strain Okayama-7 / 130 / ATCC MYA-4618 / FGSC 9003) TaxID=240176 RepID=A8N2B9_COPC7|nr:hypothetical protein CC1G_01759 [Coprinopsis cinerea okayama7\|eukprot:XP_001829079.2 hypothetical protein CC1G_01759 [Coprinopsis cinerea okayama7\